MRKEFYISEKFLLAHPEYTYVFGDNTIRRGKGGAAKFRDFPNTYGFITKKYPNNADSSFYTVDEYKEVFVRERQLLIEQALIHWNDKRILIVTKLGAGLANRYKIYEYYIEKFLIDFEDAFPETVWLAFK